MRDFTRDIRTPRFPDIGSPTFGLLDFLILGVRLSDSETLRLGPSIKYVTLFLANFDPPSTCHTLSHIPGPPESTSHISDPRLLVGLVQKSWTKVPCTNSISIVRRGFVRGFCPGWFLSVPPSVTIHLLQQKVKHHFKFHVSYV